jgi:hypothetical protein
MLKGMKPGGVPWFHATAFFPGAGEHLSTGSSGLSFRFGDGMPRCMPRVTPTAREQRDRARTGIEARAGAEESRVHGALPNRIFKVDDSPPSKGSAREVLDTSRDTPLIRPSCQLNHFTGQNTRTKRASSTAI